MPERVGTGLLEAEVALAQGQSVARVCRAPGVTEQTYYRWRKEYGGMQVAQAKRLKQLEGESARLQRAVADVAVAKQILRKRPRETHRLEALQPVRVRQTTPPLASLM